MPGNRNVFARVAAVLAHVTPAVLALLAGASIASADDPGRANVPGGPQVRPPVDIPLPREGYQTLHPRFLYMGLIYESETSGSFFNCWRNIRPAINLTGSGIWIADPASATPEILPSEVLLGWGNRMTGRSRCGNETGAVFHGYVFFDAQPLLDSLERRREASGSSSFRVLDWHLRTELRRLTGYNNRHSDCVIGRSRPLQVIARGAPASLPEPPPSLVLGGRTIAATATIDGRHLEDYIRDLGPGGSTFRVVETLANGNTEIEWQPAPGTVLDPPARGASVIPFWLISIPRRGGGTDRECLAAYGNFRLVIHYRIDD